MIELGDDRPRLHGSCMAEMAESNSDIGFAQVTRKPKPISHNVSPKLTQCQSTVSRLLTLYQLLSASLSHDMLAHIPSNCIYSCFV